MATRRKNRARAIRNQPPQRLVRTTKVAKVTRARARTRRGVMPTPAKPTPRARHIAGHEAVRDRRAGDFAACGRRVAFTTPRLAILIDTR